MKPRVAFITRQHFLKTKSDLFLIEILKEHAFVEVFRRIPEGDILEVKAVNAFKPDLVIYFAQAPSLSRHFFKIKSRRNWFIPMYDGFGQTYLAKSRFKRSILKYGGLRFICFCQKIAKQADQWGFPNLVATYFPSVDVSLNAVPQKTGPPYRIFLWQRCSEISPHSIMKVLGSDQVSEIIWKPDTQFAGEVYDTQKVRRISGWLDEADLKKLVSESDFYVAPRLQEGIGMSFLEACALGKPVIGWNDATMNEYIDHGKNGFLFSDFNTRIKLLPPSQIHDQIQISNSRFLKKWEESKTMIIKNVLEG